MRKKIAFYLSVLFFLLAGSTGYIHALNSVYNRPNPLMDYVPQELGIYDGMYSELNETDCRFCHGNSLADRHHATPTVIENRQCIPCHEIIVEAPGVVVIHDCLTSGCHSQGDLIDNGWHHLTDLSESDNCVACHNPNLIAEISPLRDFGMYPPSVVTPTPFSCENCHWGQEVSGGHPSTNDHVNMWDDYIGSYEYGKEISGNFDTHHMGFYGNVATDCYNCHSLNPDDLSWDPYDENLIRYCERCHDISTLHTIGPHVQDTPGWEAAGFHIGGSTDPTDVDPSAYRTFLADEQCFGCHGDDIIDPPPPPSELPAIDTSAAGIVPNHGSWGSNVTLRGENFGEEQYSGYMVQFSKDGSGSWISMPIIGWTDTLIEFFIPNIDDGNYEVRVLTPAGESNKVNFALINDPAEIDIDPSFGPCGQWIDVDATLGIFGPNQSEMYDSYNGVHHVVDFVATSGTYTATNYNNWSDGSFRVRFYKFFEDGIDPNTGIRNYVQDDGTGSCPDEPSILVCDGLSLGVYAMYVKTIYFGDDDGSGGLSCGDTIFQIATTEQNYFNLNDDMMIYGINPKQIERKKILRVIGINFGPTQGGTEVRIGTKNQAKNLDYGKGRLLSTIKLWSSTKIKVKITVPLAWEGSNRFVWVEQPGTFKSNFKKLVILVPLP